jgi:ABC-type Fe3+ transport system permease subunit/DNA-binding beta-propeller fold protein YncE
MNWVLFRNSLLVSGLATLLSAAFGLMAAFWLAGRETRQRAWWMAAAIAALALPPFVVTNCWMHYLGNGGLWRNWLPLNIYSLGGTIWVLALLTWPITMLAVLGAWRRLEPSQLESDMALTGGALARGLLLPLARGALTQVAVLTFVLALNNFAVPALLQVKVFPAEAWVDFNTTFNSLGALETSWPMILVPILLLIWFRKREVAWPQMESPVPAKLFRQQLGKTWSGSCGIGTAMLLLISVGLPLLQLATTQRTWSELPSAATTGLVAIWNSFALAAAAATLCVVLGLIGWRWPVGLALWVPFFVPGVLLGIGLIVVFNRPIFAAFYQSVGIVILAFGIRYLALGWNGVARAMRMTDRDLTDVARLDGASRWQMLRHVQWPQISPQAAAVWYIIFLLCLWDVESIVLIMPPGGETMAVRIFNFLHYGHNPQVDALCLLLLVLAVAPMVIWSAGRWIVKWSAECGVRSAESKNRMAMLLVIFGALFLTSCSQESSTGRTLDSKLFSAVEVIGTRGAGVGQFNKPRSLAIDHEDNLYVVDMTGRVQKFSPDGHYLLSWQMQQTDLGKPKGMTCDHDGNIVVVEPHYQRINFFTPEGKLVERWGDHGTNVGQLIMPRSAAVNSHGNLVIPEYTLVDRVQEFTHDGKLVRAFGESGEADGKFSRPEGVCVDSADRIYVADSCNHRIQVFSPEGKWLRSYGTAGSGAGELSYPYDICIDKAGRQYVCEFGNSRIQIFDKNGQTVEIIGGAGAEPGKFSNPWCIALDSKENLYVVDSQNHRVQKFLRRQDVAEQPGKSGENNVNARPHPNPLPQEREKKVAALRKLSTDSVITGEVTR